MGIFDKVSQFLGTSIEEEETEKETKEPEPLQTPKLKPKETPKLNYSDKNNVLEFNSAASNREDSTSFKNKYPKSKITTIKPKDFNDAQAVSDLLRDKIPVIVNFEDTDINEAKRIIDFISGTTYAVDGKIRQVSSKVFICAPDNVTVSSSEDDKKSNVKFLD